MDTKVFTTGTWETFTNKCKALFPFLKRTFQGTRAEWNALSSTEQANYDIVNITDDVAEGGAVVVDEVTSGNLNAVTSNAVANHLVIDNLDIGEITVAANTNYTISLSDYNIDTHNKPWVAFVYNRSNWGEFTLFGDGSTNLILRNITDSSVTGRIVIAVLHYGN